MQSSLFYISTLAFITLLLVTRFQVNTLFAVVVLSVQLFVLATWTQLEPFAEAQAGDVRVNVSLMKRQVAEDSSKLISGLKRAVHNLLTSEGAKKYYEYK